MEVRRREGCFSCLCSFWGKIKGRVTCFLSNPVQRVLKGRSVDQCVHYFLSSRDVKERNPNQDGEHALAWEKKHHESGKTKETSQTVSDNLDQEGDGGMSLMPLLDNRGMGEKIIAGGLGDQKGDEQQADQKGCCRKKAQSFKEGGVRYLKRQSFHGPCGSTYLNPICT